MKRLVFFIIAIMLFVYSCTKNATPELTAEQKTTIEKEVKEQYDKFFSTWDQLDFSSWAGYWSENSSISATSNMDYTPTRSEIMDAVKLSWSNKERRHTELSDVIITAVSIDLAYVTGFEIVEVWEKSGEHYKVKAIGSTIWKKEQSGWKIIVANESWQLIE